MIKNLHPNSPSYLLSLFNSIFSKKIYPAPWKVAIILPILKPNLNPFLSTSYRPIAPVSYTHLTLPTIYSV